MPITDQTYTDKPPLYHAHLYDASSDTLDDLNEWATSLFSPLYSERDPAFLVDAAGHLLARQAGRYTQTVHDGFFVVLSANGSISLMAPTSFEAAFARTA